MAQNIIHPKKLMPSCSFWQPKAFMAAHKPTSPISKVAPNSLDFPDFFVPPSSESVSYALKYTKIVKVTVAR